MIASVSCDADRAALHRRAAVGADVPFDLETTTTHFSSQPFSQAAITFHVYGTGALPLDREQVSQAKRGPRRRRIPHRQVPQICVRQLGEPIRHDARKISRVREGALLVRALLRELELDSWLKTSGGRGLHVIVPLHPRFEWDTVRAVAQAAVQHLAQTAPDRFVARSGPKNRVGRIFVDYLRNGRGATTVAAWSTRARLGLGVSVPVSWHELDSLRAADQWTVRNVGARLATSDPWSGYAEARQSLLPALRALEIKPPRGR